MDVANEVVGVVLGSRESAPLDFWIGVEKGKMVQLDDLVVLDTESPDGAPLTYYGIVDQVTKRFEGNAFDTDAFHVADCSLPVEVSYAAHVQVTRLNPEVFVPPNPGTPAQVVRGDAYQKGLYFDRMERKVAIGLARTGDPIYANLEFLDGTRGAHASISGVSGVATKTSYATFLLYSLFHSESLGSDAINSKALIFNVKGEDLLFMARHTEHRNHRRCASSIPATRIARRTVSECSNLRPREERSQHPHARHGRPRFRSRPLCLDAAPVRRAAVAPLRIRRS